MIHEFQNPFNENLLFMHKRHHISNNYTLGRKPGVFLGLGLTVCTLRPILTKKLRGVISVSD